MRISITTDYTNSTLQKAYALEYSQHMSRLTKFYDQYHTKNDYYYQVIKANNFTYFYILELFKIAGIENFAGSKVLDIGCGVGTLSLYAGAHGADVVGIDVSPRAIEIAEAARRSLNLKNVKFKQGELAQGRPQFDRAFCFEVIEHVENEKKFLEAIASHLLPNGLLLLSTPSSESPLYRAGWYQTFDQEVGHLRRYTRLNLQQLLEKNGFEVLFIRQVESPLRNSLFTSRLGFLIRGIKGPLVPVFHQLDRVLGRLVGYTDIQVIARKKDV